MISLVLLQVGKVRQGTDGFLEGHSQHCGHSVERRKVALPQTAEREERYRKRVTRVSHGLEMFVFIN